MASFKIRNAKQADVDFLKGKIRQDDIIEIWDMHNLDIDEAIQRSFRVSDKCWVGCINDEPIMIFGVAMHPTSTIIGLPWMIATDNIRMARYGVVKASREYVRRMMEGFNMLENYVDMRNTISKKWLKWCGFCIEEPCIMGVERKYFHRFWMKGSD